MAICVYQVWELYQKYAVIFHICHFRPTQSGKGICPSQDWHLYRYLMKCPMTKGTDCTRRGYAASVRRQSRQRLRSPNKSGNDITMELCIFTKMCFVSERTDCHGAVRLAMTRQVVFVKKASIPKEKDAAQERHQGVTGFGSLADATNAASELLIPKIDDFAKQSILRSCAIAAGKV